MSNVLQSPLRHLRLLRLLRHSGVRRKDQIGTGDFCDLRDGSRDGGSAMSFV